MTVVRTIRWTDILAECGNYRNGFVAIFRKYEGQPTDEKDGQGRTVKVTARSFALHNGIHEDTFRRWIKSSTRRDLPRSKNDLTRDVTRAARHEPEAVVDGIASAPKPTQDRIYHDLKLRRAGVDNSTANRKASQAATHQQLQPVRKAMATADLVLCVQALQEAAEHLQKAISDGAVNSETVVPVVAAHEQFSMILAEARFAVS
jgi:hypothetical protein